MTDRMPGSAVSTERTEVSVRTKTLNRLSPILKCLDSFDKEERGRALGELAREMSAGNLTPAEPRDWSNVHAHTFFSYSCEDYSPSRLVWEAVMRGLSVIGSTDFDVLDSLEEMFVAGDTLGIRTTVSIETRTFVQSYADKEINSPGEPGILYTMGVGFARLPAADSEAGKFIAALASQSRQRNLVMIGKINPVVTPASIDYEQDVLPLTPAGNATERHICAAYDNKARSVFSDVKDLAVFWADVLGRSPVDVEELLKKTGAFRNAIRAKLMKKGGVGYSQPNGGAFPPLADFYKTVKELHAIPCQAWLDGLSAGEADPERMLDDSLAWGSLCVNVIPERNWNFSDAEVKARKLAALDAFVKAARARDLPVLAGTEMNSPGQKFVDSFDAPELAPYIDDFQNAALWLYGHTIMARAADMGVVSAWADKHFAGSRQKSNAFYTELGRKAVPGSYTVQRFSTINPNLTPAQVLAVF